MSKARELSELGSVVTVDSGNVGIGTTSPDTKLQVTGTSGSTQFKAGTDVNGYFEINAFDSNPVYCVVSGNNTTAGVFGTQSNIPTIFFTNNTERGRFDTSGNFLFNSGYGSVATAYGCRAWVNFNGTGTVAIRGSGNVSSITDNGTGDYTINFTNAMPDASYSYSVCGSPQDANTARQALMQSISTTAINIITGQSASNAKVDWVQVSVAIFR